MENTGWSWGNYIFENGKILGSKILSGVKDASVFVVEKSKEGASYVVEKSKEGASYIAEKSKEGASYIAEKTKPATDKIKEGAGYIGSYAKSTYDNVKSKITGEKIENNNDNLDMNDKDGENNMSKPLIEGESKYSEI